MNIFLRSAFQRWNQ